MRSTKLSATTKLSAEHETPPIANVLLCAVLIVFSAFLCHTTQIRYYKSDKSWHLFLLSLHILDKFFLALHQKSLQ